MHLTIALLTSLLAAKPAPPAQGSGHLLAAAPAKAAAAPAGPATSGDDAAAPKQPAPPSSTKHSTSTDESQVLDARLFLCKSLSWRGRSAS